MHIQNLCVDVYIPPAAPRTATFFPIGVVDEKKRVLLVVVVVVATENTRRDAVVNMI
jgi:hypothetical protein